ncbi:serine/threonine-protein kinase [Lyngbya confervoides]|uniref:non-specific serine/threonine protein kinase n=1 Tax=Lyngbya confervoides BDU141951 TaxID=1574623 RepID=A0ABD4T513_9CYAN|nr:serine/threonine-protein kinase [Lyngbya confervoides]MCM1983503.1 serine/threonine protein kinase [Lyngbya confervoides BDU141951]
MLLNHRFKVLKQLSQGGFGATFLAVDTHMPSQRRCVIKQLRPEVPNQSCYDVALRKFKQEATLLEQLDHPQIPRLYGYFEQEGQFYLSQQWINGPTLGDQVILNGPRPEPEVVRMLVQILPVLDYLHGHQVIHRDVKPDNIILRRPQHQPVLIDFGSVKQHLKTTMSPSGGFTCSVLIGTEGFTAPEQATQRIVYSSDLYGLGITAVYLLTGKLPEEIEKDSRTGDLLWTDLVPAVSAELKAVINHAIEFSPRDRYATAQEMLQALAPLAALQATGARRFQRQSLGGEFPPQIQPSLARPSGSLLAETVLSPVPAPRRNTALSKPLPLGVAGLAIALSSALAFYLGSLTPGNEADGAGPPQNPVLALINRQQQAGDYQMAVPLALEVPQNAKIARDAQRLFAQMTALPLGAEMDGELDVLNYAKPEGKRKRSLQGLGAKTLQEVNAKTTAKPLHTKLGRSSIRVYPSVLGQPTPQWPRYEQRPQQFTQDSLKASWVDPWREIYEFENKMTLRVLYGCRTNIVLQNAAVFTPQAQLPYLRAWLREMMPEVSAAAMEQYQDKLVELYNGDRMGDTTFQTVEGNIQLMLSKEKENLIIALRII